MKVSQNQLEVEEKFHIAVFTRHHVDTYSAFVVNTEKVENSDWQCLLVKSQFL